MRKNEMSSRLMLVWALGAALCTSAPLLPAQQTSSVAQVTVSRDFKDAIAQSRAIIADSMRANGIPGVSVAVARDGRVLWSEGFGFADLENRVPVTPLTRLRDGSVSKSLTSAAVALLVERGKLDLDAPIQRYVPAFPRKKYDITTRELGGHLAGIRHYQGDEFESARFYPSVTASLDIFKNDSLLFEPGTRYSYSSYGWNLISAVIEGASGQEFLSFMRENVFEPLGLRSIVAEHQDSLIPFRAHFYERGRDGSLINAPYVDNSYKWAGGGFISNTEDLVRYGSALLHPGFLTAESLRLLFTSQHTRDGKSTGYGIGWAVGMDAAGRRTVSHSGGSVGANAYLLIYPDQKVVVAVLSNATARFVGGGTAARQIAGLFLK